MSTVPVFIKCQHCRERAGLEVCKSKPSGEKVAVYLCDNGHTTEVPYVAQIPQVVQK